MMRHPERDRAHEGAFAKILLDVIDGLPQYDGEIHLKEAGYGNKKFVYIEAWWMDHRGERQGKELMKKVFEVADANGIMIELKVDGCNPKLMSYYEKELGFVPIGGAVMRHYPSRVAKWKDKIGRVIDGVMYRRKLKY